MVKEYFKNDWKPDWGKYSYSGWELLNKISNNETILDIGCGYNLFKGRYGDKLYGIDPANDSADEVISIEKFDADGKQWDVVICLGSLNFGSIEDVEPQVQKAVKLTKVGGRLYWRQNPGLNDHRWKNQENITFFPWTIDLNYNWAKKYGCSVIECKWDNTRIYSEWIKENEYV